MLVSEHNIESQRSSITGILGLWIGIGSCLGISIVANFQETNVRIVHFVGAFICFACGTIYFWMQVSVLNNKNNLKLKICHFLFIIDKQAIISYRLHPYTGSMVLAHIRLGLSVLCTIFFIVASVTGIISHILFEGQDPRKW